MRSIKKKDFEIWCISSNGFLILITACTDSLTQSERKENDGDRKTPSHAKSKTQREERWCSVIERWYYHYFFFIDENQSREWEKKQLVSIFVFISFRFCCYWNLLLKYDTRHPNTMEIYKRHIQNALRITLPLSIQTMNKTENREQNNTIWQI